MSPNVAKSFKKIKIATFGSILGHLTDFQRKRPTDICNQAYFDLRIALFCVIGPLNEPYWDTEDSRLSQVQLLQNGSLTGSAMCFKNPIRQFWLTQVLQMLNMQ